MRDEKRYEKLLTWICRDMSTKKRRRLGLRRLPFSVTCSQCFCHAFSWGCRVLSKEPSLWGSFEGVEGRWGISISKISAVVKRNVTMALRTGSLAVASGLLYHVFTDSIKSLLLIIQGLPVCSVILKSKISTDTESKREILPPIVHKKNKPSPLCVALLPLLDFTKFSVVVRSGCFVQAQLYAKSNNISYRRPGTRIIWLLPVCM